MFRCWLGDDVGVKRAVSGSGGGGGLFAHGLDGHFSHRSGKAHMVPVNFDLHHASLEPVIGEMAARTAGPTFQSG